MGQKGLPSISNPSSFRFVSGQPVNDSGNNKKQHSGTGYHEDGMEKDLDELSDEEWFQTGVDFVLSPQPSGHAVSMQGTLLQLAPPTLDSDSRWQVSAEVFQKLFEMADKLDLNGYITPVQAWNRIRDHENFPRLTRERLKTLQNAMRPHIKCQGFAAIMEEAIFEILLNKALGP
ncbi:hypothetical protein N7489_010382 [Penicillium chrysogenum]|uniref:Uncharacterized protein n=1 Tax=Penicillium chrysogenum TaxID=5076 RepID=A0ABQ8WUM0_PENCH|nr:uncharacterized protein N7489_010382 [Penicillium chrysogenum]KAJ5229674.1 hypothetical protein N7489_010382 [Penicillium chrysogenum]KAJ5259077.1 hypothetical protein N7524_010633 [Penicillium chrysogenum]KAJ5282442.1 hypothetical protein N7505_000422 [Penicillium chrysogenum]KAJ6169552.1 hypothetical protein N7497_002395 [Penicillium chrysogenum]